MLKIMKMLMAAVVAGMLSVSGAYAMDDQGPGGQASEKKHEEMFNKMTKELDLTADQQAKLKANKEAKREKMKSLREAMKANKAKLREAVKQPGATRESVQPIIDAMKALQGQMADQMVDGIFGAKSILTPEQFEKMQNKMEERKKERKGKVGDWHNDKM